MPATWKEVQGKYPQYAGSVWNPRYNIIAAALYMQQQWQFWGNHRTEASRYKLALANYNAGGGNILKAQKLCNDLAEYEEIVPPCLARVTGERNAHETTEYVHKIWNVWYPSIVMNQSQY